MAYRALVLPGIQNTPEDWEPLREASRGMLDLVVEPHGVDAAGLEREEWTNRVIAAESELVRTCAADLLIAHSYGTYRAVSVLERNPRLRGAVLITPPRNEIGIRELQPVIDPGGRHDDPDASWSRRCPETTMQQLMWNLALEMPDATFSSFAARHAENYRKNRRTINRQLQFLREDGSIQRRLDEYESDAPVLVFQCPQDLWHPGVITPSRRVEVDTFTDQTGHYPHVSRPKGVTSAVSSWLRDRLGFSGGDSRDAA